MIAPVFSAAALGPVTANMSQTNDPVLNKEINTAIGFLSPTQRAAAWGNMDKYVTQQAFVVPWLWDNDVAFASKDVHIVTWSYANNSQDFGNISLTNA
jgi:hypothetical protein